MALDARIQALLDETGQPPTVAGVEEAARRLLAEGRHADVLKVTEAAPPGTPGSAPIRELEARAALALGDTPTAASMAWLAGEDGVTIPLLQLMAEAAEPREPAIASAIRRRMLGLAPDLDALSPEDRALAEAEVRCQVIAAEAWRRKAESGAEAALDWLETEHPDDAVASPALVRLRGLLHAELGEPEDAIRCLSFVMRAYPEDAAMLAEYVWSLLDAGRVEQAVSGLVLFVRPERLPGISGWTLKEVAYRRAGRLRDALAVVEDGVAATGGDRDLRGRRALLLWELGRKDEARAEAEAVLAGGAQADALATFGYLARDRGDLQAAAEAFTFAWHQRPDRVLWIDDAARAAVAIGDLERARSLYRLALYEEPRNPFVHRCRVRLEMDRGDPASAEAAAREYVAAAPERSDAWGLLARALRWKGDEAGAREAVREGLGRPPVDDDLRQLAAELGIDG